jgi:hypothetical protein
MAFTNVLLLLSILDAEIEPSPLDKPSACLREIVSLKSVWREYLSTRSSSIQDDWCDWNRCIGEYRRRPCTDCLSNSEGACRFADKAIARAGPATSPSMLIAPKNVFLRASVRFLSTSTALNAVVPPTEWVRLMASHRAARATCQMIIINFLEERLALPAEIKNTRESGAVRMLQIW